MVSLPLGRWAAGTPAASSLTIAHVAGIDMTPMAAPFYAAAARAGFRCEDISDDAVARPLLDEIEKKHFLDNAEDLYAGLGRGPVVLVRLTMGAAPARPKL